MSNFCAIIPQVKNKQGELVDSKLFTDLLSVTNNNREEAKKIYTMTKSDKFKAWFGDSKVVDENGEPLVVYHNSDVKIDKFNSSETGIYFSEDKNYWPDKAVTIPAFINIENPEYGNTSFIESKPVNNDGLIWTRDDALDFLGDLEGGEKLQRLKDLEYIYEAVVFEPNQIKSIYNNGNFDSLSDVIFENRILDPIQEYMFKNKIPNQGRDYRKALPVIKKLRAQFPDYNVRIQTRGDGGYLIVHDTVAAKILSRGPGHTYYGSLGDAMRDLSEISMKDYLQRIIDNSSSKLHRHTAGILLANLDKIPHTTMTVENRPEFAEKEWIGHYYAASGLVELNLAKWNKVSKQEYEETFLHELVHAFTMSALNNPKTAGEIQFAKDIKKVYDIFKNSKINEAYGLKNHYEFVAELMANSYFVSELKKTKPSLVQKIVEAIKKLLGLELTNRSEEINNLLLGIGSFISTEAKPKLIQGDLRVLNKDVDESKPYYLDNGFVIQHSNIEAMKNGDKRITIRPVLSTDGLHTFGDAKFRITNVYGKKVNISEVKNPALLKKNFKGDMGFDETNPKFQHITDFFNGIGEMYIYQIQKIDDTIVNIAKRHIPKPTVSITPSKTKYGGVTSQINDYTSTRITNKGHLPEIDKLLLHIHKKVKYDVGKINKQIQSLDKELKKLTFGYKKDLQVIIDDYVTYNGGVYDTGYQNSGNYKTLNSAFEAETDRINAEKDSLNDEKNNLNSMLADLEATPDLSLHDVQYFDLALGHLQRMEVATYDLNTQADLDKLAEDYNYVNIIIRSKAHSGLESMAKKISEKLLTDISGYIATLSNSYLNTSGLANPNINIDSLLETNDDIMLLEKIFTGFGDYPRLEAQLIHALTIDGKQKARLKSVQTGNKIMEHLHKLQAWGKKNGYTNVLGKGSIRKIYGLLIEQTNTGRLDLVKPYTTTYYNTVSGKLKQLATTTDPAEKTAIKQWLRDNYYTKPTSGSFMNPKYEFIQANTELKEFYEFFKETVREGYAMLPDYITLNNDEKIPSLMKDSFWEFFDLRKQGIMKSIWLAGKTLLFGHGHVEMYDQAGNPKSKFELEEFNNDNIKMRMTNEISADKKSIDLAMVLYEFASFTNDYNEMTKVLPKVRMIQNIVETKTYNTGIQGALTKLVGAGEKANITSAINMYIDAKIRKDQDKNWLRIPLMGSQIVDNNGVEIGQSNFYASDLIRQMIKYVRVLYLGLNPFSAFSNVSAGLVNDFVEATGGEYFSKRQLMKAMVIYGSASLVNRKNKITDDDTNKTKVALISEYIQPLQEVGEWQDKRTMDMGAATIAGQTGKYIFDKTFIMQEWGEDFVQKITMIAYLLNRKTNGKSHWSLFSVQNNSLVWDEQAAGMKHEDVVMHEREIIKKMNRELHGNYSKDNSSVYDGQILYQAGIVFKKWLPAMVQSRLQARRYDYSKGKYVEGRFRTVPKAVYKGFHNMFVGMTDVIKGQQNLLTSKKEITKDDMIAIKKTLADISFFLLFTALSGVLMPPPDDEDRKWYIPDWAEDVSIWDDKREFENSDSVLAGVIKAFIANSNRLAGETMQMYNYRFYNDIIMRHALLGLLDEQRQALIAYWNQLVLPEDARQLKIQKGINKGENKAFKETRDLIPYYRQLDKGIKTSKKKVNDFLK